jgi:tetratricopeptide (TPR) repeat protein
VVIPPSRRPLLVAALLALGGTLVYLNALPNAFHFDDSHSIVENPAIRSFGEAGRWFTDTRAFTVLKENTNYRPVLLATYAVNYALGGLRPAGFRVFNLLGHLGCALLAFLLARELAARLWPEPRDARRREWVPVLTGAVFVLHPLQSEIVNYISSRSDGLCALFYLASLLAWVRANAAAGRRALLLRAVAVAAFALALLVKEVGLTLPAAVWLWEVLVERRPAVRLGWRRLGRYAALAVVAGLYLAVRAYMLRDYDVRFRATTPPLAYFATQLRAWFHYLRLFVLPVGQCVDPDYPFSRSLVEPRVLAAAAGVIGVAAGAWPLRRRRPEVTFGLGFFLLALAPTSSFFPIAEAVNEHRPYLGNLGLCLLAAVLLAEVAPRAAGRRGAAALAAAVLLVLGGLTVARNRVWRDDYSLWRDVVAKAPHNGRAHLNYGLALLGRGRPDEALAQYEACARLWPDYSYCYINRSVLYRQRKEWDRALADLDRAGRLTPGLFWVPYFRGVTWEEMGRPADAERAFARTLAVSPSFLEARFRRARVLAALGRTDEARAEAGRAAARGHHEAARLAASLAGR